MVQQQNNDDDDDDNNNNNNNNNDITTIMTTTTTRLPLKGNLKQMVGDIRENTTSSYFLASQNLHKL